MKMQAVQSYKSSQIFYRTARRHITEHSGGFIIPFFGAIQSALLPTWLSMLQTAPPCDGS
jgi:hypothetical protein